MVVMLMPVFMLLVPMMLMVLMPKAMLAGLFVMMVMIFVYHSSVHFPTAKVRRPACNPVAIFAGIG